MRLAKFLAVGSLLLIILVLSACTREVVKEVVVTPAPGPTATPEATVTEAGTTTTPDANGEARVYQIGIAEDLTTTNHWAYVGPDGTVWNGYVLADDKPALYGYSAKRFDSIPSLAADFPSPLMEEAVEGRTLWSTEVTLKEGVSWSDGLPVTADDFVFTAHTASELQLTGSWPAIVDPDFFERAEADGPYDLKIYFKKRPGLARWQFGLAFMPIFSRNYWEPVVAEAKEAADVIEQQNALYAHVQRTSPALAGSFSSNGNGAHSLKRPSTQTTFSRERK